jgi:hypothetical protein
MHKIVISTEVVNTSLISEVQQLFQKNNIDKNYNYWQFEPRFNATIKAVTARVNGLLIGFNATMPIKLNTIELTEIDAIWSCDFIVDKEYRKKGVGHLIKTELKQKFPIPTMALGISDPAIKVLKREGWQQLDGLKVYKKTLRPDSIKSLTHYFLGILQSATSILSIKTKSIHNIYDVKRPRDLPSAIEIDILWQKVRSEYGNCIARNAEYMKWRYSKVLTKNYSFLTSYNNKGELSGLLVYRIQSSHLRVIDYLGSITNSLPLRELLITLENFPQLKTISFNASNIVLTKQLIKLGYVQSSYQSKFACYMPYDQNIPQRWLLTAGDSDGEFIQAIAEQNKTEKKHLPLSKFSLIYVNEIEFDQLKSQWQQLLDNSPVDKLFMSWLWMNTWWHTWKEKIRETYNTELAIILIKKDDELVGIIPLYKITKSFAFITYTEYQLLGNAWRIIPSVRSEYIEPIFSHKFTSELMTKFALWIKSLPINSTLIWPDNPSKNLATIFSSFIDYGAKINLNDKSFSHYITTLGKNTRLKGITRQKLLLKEYPSHQWGEFALSRDDVDCFFELLNNFHIQRWGKVCFDEYAQKFHKHLILANSTLNFQLLYLKVDNQIVSVLFNIIIDNTVYNIQSGFDSLFSKKYSLGTMHLLFSIEQNFHQHKYAYFDLLAGQGLNTAYKNHYKGEKTTFVTYQIFSLPAIAFIFRRLLKLKKVILTLFNR